MTTRKTRDVTSSLKRKGFEQSEGDHAFFTYYRLEEDVGPVDYNHVEGKHVGKLKVRYRNVGRLLPREIPIEDE